MSIHRGEFVANYDIRINVDRYLRHSRVSTEKVGDASPGLNAKIHARRSAVVTTTRTQQRGGGREREDYQVSATDGVQNASHAG